ncbi:Oligopeptide transporter OPT superfamily [Artemisia annua]|uniref:Oligopeptide transporter OPT superfamily n=1 Tax=Artemisia annua TaxID=35608 RepID=A0A2U1LST1_ARTAN|nr:Oligopeptide transporter OPT superfamily [Artemisia annua]
MTGFSFVSSFVGFLALVPLRKIVIIDYKLTYPSGTATAVLITGFHTPKGHKMASSNGISFLWLMIAPSLGFCNAYTAGLTDVNMAYNYGKVALFVLAAMSGNENGVVAGLVGCGLIRSIVSITSDLMHDFKTGHLTMTSPRSILVSQAIGTAIGCVVAPLTLFLFHKAFDIGNPDDEYKAPYALIYRNMTILDTSPTKIGQWVPLPMPMAVPFLVGAYFAIDMCVGSLVVFIWHKNNKQMVKLMVPAVASGLSFGDGLWILPSSILALAGIRPPVCISFLPTKT